MNDFVLAPSVRDLLHWRVYGGRHFRQDGWLMLFRFPNGLQASVVYGPWTRGIEVGVMDDLWLVDVFEDLCGEDVVEALFEVMKRPPSASRPLPPNSESTNLGEEEMMKGVNYV